MRTASRTRESYLKAVRRWGPVHWCESQGLYMRGSPFDCVEGKKRKEG